MEDTSKKASSIQQSFSSNKQVSVRESDNKPSAPDSQYAARVASQKNITAASSKASRSELNPDDIKSSITDSVDPFQYLGPDELRSSRAANDKVSGWEGVALSSIFDDLEEEMEMEGGTMSKQHMSEFLNYDDRFRQEVTEQEMEFLPVVRTVQNPFDIDESKLKTLGECEAEKIQNNRKILQEIIRKARQELDDTLTFQKMKSNINQQSAWKKAPIALIDRYQESKTDLLDLCQKTVDYAQDMSEYERDSKTVINFLKDKLHLTIQKCKQDERYARAFLEARNGHNLDILNHELKMGEMKMKGLEIDMARDKFCHRNVEDFFALVDLDIQKQIDYWNDKFEKDLEDIDKKLNEKQNSIRAQQIQIEMLNKTIEERMVELGPWEEQKRKDRDDRCEYLRLYYSARKIQRWWR